MQKFAIADKGPFSKIQNQKRLERIGEKLQGVIQSWEYSVKSRRYMSPPLEKQELTEFERNYERLSGKYLRPYNNPRKKEDNREYTDLQNIVQDNYQEYVLQLLETGENPDKIRFKLGYTTSEERKELYRKDLAENLPIDRDKGASWALNWDKTDRLDDLREKLAKSLSVNKQARKGKYAEIVSKYYFSELNQRQIAEEIGVSQQEIAKRLKKAHKLIAREPQIISLIETIADYENPPVLPGKCGTGLIAGVRKEVAKRDPACVSYNWERKPVKPSDITRISGQAILTTKTGNHWKKSGIAIPDLWCLNPNRFANAYQIKELTRRESPRPITIRKIKISKKAKRTALARIIRRRKTEKKEQAIRERIKMEWLASERTEKKTTTDKPKTESRVNRDRARLVNSLKPTKPTVCGLTVAPSESAEWFAICRNLQSRKANCRPGL